MEAAYTITVDVDEEFAGLVEPDTLEAAARETLRLAGSAAAALTVAVVDDDQVRVLNQSYRGLDAPTDVLSFASHDAAPAGAPEIALPPELAAELAAYLGDVVIAYPYTAAQAAANQSPVASELRLLTVHGVLHLLGYDHDTAAAEERMWAAQDAVLEAFGERSPIHRVYDA